MRTTKYKLIKIGYLCAFMSVLAGLFSYISLYDFLDKFSLVELIYMFISVFGQPAALFLLLLSMRKDSQKLGYTAIAIEIVDVLYKIYSMTRFGFGSPGVVTFSISLLYWLLWILAIAKKSPQKVGFLLLLATFGMGILLNLINLFEAAGYAIAAYTIIKEAAADKQKTHPLSSIETYKTSHRK